MKKGGWNSAPDYTPQRGFWRSHMLVILLLAVGVVVGVLAGRQAKAQTSQAPIQIKSIYWSDADSGRLNETIKFRLSDHDAPETGGVGAAIGGAKCELERKRGFASKEWIVGFTRDVELSIAKDYGLDKYDRLVIDLNAAGQDVARAGIDAAHLKPWPHKGRRALVKKPDWCH